MKSKSASKRYRLFRKGAYGTFYVEDVVTRQQSSLKTRDRQEAERLLQARCEAADAPDRAFRVGMAYLGATDPLAASRTWRDVVEAYAHMHPQGSPTRHRILSAGRDRALAPLLRTPLLRTRPDDFLAAVASGKVSTNAYLRRFHNLALDLGWLARPILPRRRWPKVRHLPKRAITEEEHLRIVQREGNPERRAFYGLCWHLGGVCPGWLAREQGPIHTADGHPMTPAELARWEAWRNINARPDAPQDPPAALGGRPLGPLYRKGCCVDPVNLLAHGPLETPPGQGTAARRFQQSMEPEQHRRLCAHLIDRARGIAHRALSTWDRSENPLWELLAAMDKHFPDVPPMADPADEAAATAAAAFLESAAQQPSTPPGPRPTHRSGPSPRKSSKRHPIPAGSGARRPRPYQHEST